MNLETQKHKKRIEIHQSDDKPWPFEPVQAKFCFLRGPLRWLTAAKNANVSWFLNFRVRVFMKSAVRDYSEWEGYTDKMINLLPPISVAATKW